MHRLLVVLFLLVLPSTLWAETETKKPVPAKKVVTKIVSRPKTVVTKPAATKAEQEIKDPPVSLTGSPQVLRWENQVAKKFQMPWFEDDRVYGFYLFFEFLRPIPKMVCMGNDLPTKWRYALPYATYFVGDLGNWFLDKFDRCAKLNSASRTKSYQAKLEDVNRNAAGTEGPMRSLHLTGSTVDITKKGMTSVQISKTREKLLCLAKKKMIYPTEESVFQSVFHVMVFPTYTYDSCWN